MFKEDQASPFNNHLPEKTTTMHLHQASNTCKSISERVPDTKIPVDIP
jgi:hypothetical protein